MDEHQWGEIFNLNEEIKKIEEAVDKRLEETLAEDPHVIEVETVHYGEGPADPAEMFRMKQSLPTFGAVGNPAPIAPPEDTVWMAGPVEDYDAQRAVAAAAEQLACGVTGDETAADHEFGDAATGNEVSGDVVTGRAAETETTADGATREMAAEDASTTAMSDAGEESEEPEEQAADGAVPVSEPVEETPAPAAVDTDVLAEDTGAAADAKDQGTEEPATRQDTDRSPQTPRDQETANKRRTLVALLIVIAILVLILGYGVYKGYVIPQRQYAAAEALLANGDYDGAITAFTEISGYGDAADRIFAAEYDQAAAYVDAGSYTEAIDYIDNLNSPAEEFMALRADAIYQIALQYYEQGNREAAAGELLRIQNDDEAPAQALELLHQIQYEEASDALAVYDFETAEPILAALGDYADAPILLEQVRGAVDVVYTDVARNDNGKEIKGSSQYLWVHSVITPGAVMTESEEALSAETGAGDDTQRTSLRELAGATDAVEDDAIKVLMMHLGTTDAAMTYTNAEPIETDKGSVVTKEVSSYAAIDETFGTEQMVFAPQTLQRSDTDYTFAFEGAKAYAAKDADSDEVRMECKMADDGYWAKTRRVYADMDEDGNLVGVPKAQLRTWTKVLNETIADEVRERFLENMTD